MQGWDYRGFRERVFASGLTPLCRLLALTLNEYMPRAFPSVPTLAKVTGMSRNSVMRAVQELELAGWLRVTRNAGGSNLYVLVSPPVQGELFPPQPVPEGDGGSPREGLDQSQRGTGVVPERDPKQTNLSRRSKQDPKQSVSSSGGAPSPARVVFEHWKERMGHPRAKLDDKRRAAIDRRLRQGWAVDALREAIDGCSLSDWNMGRDPKTHGRRYDGLELILRDAEHIERFQRIARGEDSGSSKATHQPDCGLSGFEGIAGWE